MMLKEVLNGQSGRLFESLRNRRSLCYNTGTLSTAGFGQGMFLGYVLTAPETENEARDALVDELAEHDRNRWSPTVEFERARAKLLGNLLIGAQSNGVPGGPDPARPRLRPGPQRSGPAGRSDRRLHRRRGPRGGRDAMVDPDKRFEVTLGP